jgi:poly-gamma-glutamate capsule biosynthesis protein CapA/YwtB (metallophosphatase superfamily)
MVTVALVGDVMLGRGVNEALRTMSPEQPWGDVLPLLGSADLRIINLECALTDHTQPWRRTPKVFHFRADPSAIEVLRAAHVDGCSLANNHTLDFEEQGLLDTLEHLEATGIPYAGAARNREEAAQPAILGYVPTTWWRCWPSQTTNRPLRRGRTIRGRTIYRSLWSRRS